MHPDDLQLAAYLDLPPGADEHARLRAHVLTCPRCTARVARLRDDARAIPAALAAGPALDVRAAVRARLARRPARGLAGALWLVGGLAGLLLFALLLGARSGAVGHAPDRLLVADRAGQRLVALDAREGAPLGEVALGERPTRLAYDARRERLYALTDRGVAAVDLPTLAVRDRWAAPAPSDDTRAGMALDVRGGRLYVARGGDVTALALDGERLTEVHTYALGGALGDLALTADGGTLFALDEDRATLWALDVDTGTAAPRELSDGARRGPGALALTPDGRTLLVLLGATEGGAPPEVWGIGVASGAVEAHRALAAQPPPWDLLALNEARIAVARGDGSRGGVELLDAHTLDTVASLDPDADEHRLAGGPPGAVFALNWLHGTVARYDVAGGTLAWRTPPRSWQPWDSALVPGGWQLNP